jgi:hypothetical protein
LIELGPPSGGLSYGWKGDEGSFVLLPSGDYSGLSTTIAGQNRNDWTLMIGSNFGVTRQGTIYCAGGEFSGVTATNLQVSSGNFGPWDINERYFGYTD